MKKSLKMLIFVTIFFLIYVNFVCSENMKGTFSFTLTVTRVGDNLYSILEYPNILLKTSLCYEYAYYKKAYLTYTQISGYKLVFDAYSSCYVSGYYYYFPLD